MEKYINQISINPEIRFGKPCIKGTRITVGDIFTWLASGMTNDEDYYYLLLQKGFPPKIVLLKMGNQSTKKITEILTKHKQDIYGLYESKEQDLLY